MRIWSLHPSHLDAKGLVALWRETLLAKHVLQGKTKGYKHHPQLKRFRSCAKPAAAINCYLYVVYEEAASRGYSFDKKKIGKFVREIKIPVTSGQLEYERRHLARKLKLRDPKKYSELKKVKKLKIHPLFRKVRGGVEEWEVV
ncbi:MAG TPA: pyrimidine dimer DNA glycosylase/endonuclease V [Bacteroidia bacterium]|jgi:hypothetical protein